MNCFRRCLGTRYADVCDWVDYRPDADFRPFLGLPVLVLFGWSLGGFIGFELALAFAALVATLAAGVGAVLILGWIAVGAAMDFLATVRVPEMAKVSSQRASAPLG